MRTLLLIALALCLVACSSSPDSIIKGEWGKPIGEEDKDGLRSYEYKDGVLTVDYNFTQHTDSSVYQEEIGIRIGMDIKNTFRTLKDLKSITVTGYAPLIVDNLGNHEWAPRVRFTVTRELYEQINWNSFDPQKLFEVCEGKMLR